MLAIDLMRAYFDPASPLCLPSRDCLASAARVLAAARGNGVPVIHTRVEFAPDGSDGGVFVRKVPALEHLFGGGPMSELMPEVAPVDGRAGDHQAVRQRVLRHLARLDAASPGASTRSSSSA